MSTPEPAEQHRPNSHARAFATAQRAFANGWIDIDDLDRRLAIIADAPDEETAERAVADLDTVDRRLARQESREVESVAEPREANPAKRSGRIAANVVFGVLLFAFAINLIVWGTVSLATEPQYFWPVWMLIPVGIVGAGWVGARIAFRDNHNPENR